jgi:hypothetical protein
MRVGVRIPPCGPVPGIAALARDAGGEVRRGLVPRLAERRGALPCAGAARARLRFGPGRHVPVHLGALGPKGARLAGEHREGLRMAAQWDPTYAGTVRPHLTSQRDPRATSRKKRTISADASGPCGSV